MKISLITNALPTSGVGYYSTFLGQALKRDSTTVLDEIVLNDHTALRNGKEFASRTPWPGFFGSKSIGWIRLGSAVANQVARDTPDVVHITNQTLSFLKTKPPTVITVHDIIELTDPQDTRAALLNRYLYSGITKADALIAVSQYSKDQLCAYYGLSADTVTVIPNGVGKEFYPIPDFEQTVGYQTLRRELKIEAGMPIMLSVGSDHPRKNLPVALQAFAALLKAHPTAVFIKVGDAGLPAGRADTLQWVDNLHLQSAVRFLAHVSYERLNELYNLADVLIYPSTLEGFGLPPLQAMAAGLPVVTSNTTSLPEVVGDAGMLCAPTDSEGFAKAMDTILSDTAQAQGLITKGIERAKQFSWNAVALKTLNVYKKIAPQV